MKKYTIEDSRKTKGQQTANGPGGNENYKKTNNKNINDPPPVSKDSSDQKKASVWVLNGTTLTRHSIRIGMEDGTQVQVLSGLTTADEVVDGVQQTTAKGSANATQRSPFMPQRRSNRPAGGSQTSGGNRPSR
jgi:HlyD family secretion protein